MADSSESQNAIDDAIGVGLGAPSARPAGPIGATLNDILSSIIQHKSSYVHMDDSTETSEKAGPLRDSARLVFHFSAFFSFSRALVCYVFQIFYCINNSAYIDLNRAS